MEQNIYRVPCIYHKVKRDSGVRPLIVSVPGSKSITNRALLLATLAEGESILRDVLFSDDSRHFLKCLQALGFETAVDEAHRTVTVKGTGGNIPFPEASLYVGSAGTAARFLTACLGLSEGVYHLDASPQMRKRPMNPLLDSLQELGCEVICEGEAGHFPFTLKGHGFRRNQITINIEKSSQFLSGLLIAACLSKEDFTVITEGLHGRAYIEMTVKMMQQFGVQAKPLYHSIKESTAHQGANRDALPCAYQIAAGQHYRALDYQVQPDVSAACYFYAMSPLLNVPVQVRHVHTVPDFLQGDTAFLHLLEEMGCRLEADPAGDLLLPPESGIYHGVSADLSAFSDQAITLAALAPFADGPTTIKGIGHIRCQESDRITAIVTELCKMGIRCQESQDSITVYPGTPSPATVETYDDHRMAMGFSLIGLRSEGICIQNPGCCRKTFEDYFEVLDSAIADMIQ